MGCGSSRMGSAGGEEVPPRIRSLLKRRLEEMKKRSKSKALKGYQTLPKKDMIENVGLDGEDSINMRSARVAPAPVDQDDVVVNNKEVIYEEINEKVIEMVKEPKDHDHDDREEEDDDEEEEELGRMSNFDERMICPGSPSFRVYCLDLSDDDESEDKDEEKKKMEMESGIIAVNAKDQRIGRGKKGRKGRKFGIGLPKATMPKKYRFNVTGSCYSKTHHHHSRLLQDKPSTT